MKEGGTPGRRWDATFIYIELKVCTQLRMIYQANWLTLQIGSKWYGVSQFRIYDFETGTFLSRDLLKSLNKYRAFRYGAFGEFGRRWRRLTTRLPEIPQSRSIPPIRFIPMLMRSPADPPTHPPRPTPEERRHREVRPGVLEHSSAVKRSKKIGKALEWPQFMLS